MFAITYTTILTFFVRQLSVLESRRHSSTVTAECIVESEEKALLLLSWERSTRCRHAYLAVVFVAFKGVFIESLRENIYGDDVMLDKCRTRLEHGVGDPMWVWHTLQFRSATAVVSCLLL